MRMGVSSYQINAVDALDAYDHHDHLDTPIQATDKAGNIVWAASYNAFGQASIITPQATADRPTITSNLRLPGQYEDVETGLHYNYRRFYDPATGRYVTSDPIGLEGGISRFAYVNHDPLNGYDPMGEAAGGRRGGGGGGASSAFDLPSLPQGAVDGIAGFGDGMLSVISLGLWNGSSARGALGIGSVNSCSDNYGYGKIGGEVAAMLILGQARNRCNSFTEDTLVNVKPQDANGTEAIFGKASLKPIGQLQVGDEVLALAEWQSKGSTASADERLRYERVVDIFTSYKQQTLVYLTLDNSQTLTATEGHPFKTTDGWRDAIMLKKGSKLLLKGGDADGERNIGIADVRTEQKTVQVFNLEVANAHTFFVGVDGVLVHNTQCTPWNKLQSFKGKTKTDGKKLYEKDYTHKDMEVYDKRGNHLGSADVSTGAMTKPPVPGRTIRR